MRKILFTFILTLFCISGFSQTLNFSLRYNTKEDDSKNYCSWTYKNSTTKENKKIKDSYDAVSGASVKNSTGQLKTILLGKDRKTKTAPKGLYELLLFPVSPYSVWQDEGFSVKAEGKKISLDFTHRGNYYKIETDRNGWADISSSFSIFEGFAVNHFGTFEIEEEYLLDKENTESRSLKESEKNDDGKKINPPLTTCIYGKNLNYDSLKFARDCSKLESRFKGKIRLKFDGKILTATGKLTLIKEKYVEEPEKTEVKEKIPQDSEKDNSSPDSAADNL